MAAEALPTRAGAIRLLSEGDFVRARETLRAVVEHSDEPEDRLLLGRLAFVATDYAEARNQLERAYREFQDAGLPRLAARQRR